MLKKSLVAVVVALSLVRGVRPPSDNMFRRCLFLAAALSLCDVVVLDVPPNPECPASRRELFEVSVRSSRNASGEWVTRLEGRKEAGNRTDDLAMDFKHWVVECGEKQSFHFQGIFGERPTEDRDRLLFHPKCGKNVAILNHGRSIEKLNGEERIYGVAYTNRHLRLNELFEVKLDKRVGTKFNHILGIGITTSSPEDGEIPNHINSLKSGTWVLYHNGIWNNGSHIRSRGLNLDELKVGDRVGLMRTDSGTLLLFINGKEEAIASNTPYPVYGVFECYGDVIRATLTS